MLPESTEITCYQNFGAKTKKRSVGHLYRLQFPLPWYVGGGYRKIVYKWSRIIRGVTPEGEIKQVTVKAITKIEVPAEIYLLGLENGKTVKVCESSRVLTPEGYVQARDLAEGDKLVGTGLRGCRAGKVVHHPVVSVRQAGCRTSMFDIVLVEKGVGGVMAGGIVVEV